MGEINSSMYRLCREYRTELIRNDCGCDVTENAETNVTDCAGSTRRRRSEDNCGTCDNDPENDCPQDCAGVFGGDSVNDECGTCDNDPSNDCIQDCAGTGVETRC